jgi:D-alanyl-D-alanine carboxypeptidase/D-alanyl-D-alanine-endopeptidase (penicillin-binding protein 4)
MILLLLWSVLSLDSILNQPQLKPASYGIYISRLDNNRTIFQVNSDKLLVPASNMKIITTAAALYYLGPDFHYKTRLAIRGIVRNAILHGDLVLIGGGDPKFSLMDAGRFVERVKSLGIREVTGNIIVVDDYFTRERLPVGWAWHYLDAKYAPEISALSMNENVVNVKMEATQPGAPVKVTMEPETRYVRLVNRMLTRVGSDSMIIYRTPEANIIFVDGALSRDRVRSIKVAVKNPAFFAGTYFRELLAAANIKVAGGIIEGRDDLFTTVDSVGFLAVVDSVVSPPLTDIVRETNTESVNLYAEVMLKTLGVQKYGEGSFLAGIRALKDFLSLCGVDTSFVSLTDGSGLSKYNIVSARDLAMVLRYVYRQDMFRDFYESLALDRKSVV